MRPNLRFSIVIFGTALVYTLIDRALGADHQISVNPPVLLVSLAITVVTALALEKIHINSH